MAHHEIAAGLRPSKLVRCACGNPLAVHAGDVWAIHHHRRQIVAQQVISITCEDCGRTLMVAPPRPLIAALRPGETPAAGCVWLPWLALRQPALVPIIAQAAHAAAPAQLLERALFELAHALARDP